MTLIRRITSLFKADMHGILDSIEDPQLVLKFAVREMQEAIAADEKALVGLASEIARAQGALDAADKRRSEICGQIDLCFGAGDETLARNFIRKRLEQDRYRENLVKHHESLSERKSKLAAAVEAKKDRLLGVTQKMEVLSRCERDHCGGLFSESLGQSIAAISDDEVEVAFLAEAKKRAETAAA